MSTSSGKQPATGSGADPAPKPSRRVFSPAYKLAMVAEYENAPNGEKGAILRREGLYSSHIIEWTRARNAGHLGHVDSGGKTDTAAPSAPRVKKSADQIELEKLRQQNEKLRADLTKTRMALDIMGKAHALLEELSGSADNDNPPRRS
ncbi:transposase [Plantactinospora sp. KBS50]|uniref:transposase n=1 Tax=Plantactinospora sp. KBS50 TaxID=2024580 RepID=UPI0012FE5EB1|nr:transposase [Plantactinospora sp. KBS50]